MMLQTTFCYRIFVSDIFTKTVLFNVVFILLNQSFVLINSETVNDSSCNEPIIEILVSPMISRTIIRELELMWHKIDTRTGDWVGLYNEDPLKNDSAKPLFTSAVNDDENWVRTNIQEERDTLLPFQTMCLGYWAVYWRKINGKDIKVASSCLQTNPTWMQDSIQEIKNTRVKDLFIPGTHDSAASLVSHYPFRESIFQKFVYTQAEDVTDQLIMGARYLDIRVGFDKNVYWANHGPVSVQPLNDVFDKVKYFMKNTKEIVILDIHGFPVGFKSYNDHLSFANYLIHSLKDYMAENVFGWDATLQDIWSSEKRLIVSYNNDIISQQFRRQMWPKISQKWGDTQSGSRLFEYLKQFMSERKPNHLWAAMAELTPNTFSVLRYRKGLREMAYLINKNLSKWFHGSWGQVCNVVAVDFLRSTGIVNAAIKWNKCRSK